MPRTFQATIALIVTLNVLAVLTIINVWQTNSAEKNVIALRARVDQVQQSNSQILAQLASGVAVNVQAGGQGAGAGSGDAYAAALNEPGNLLVAATDQLIFPDAKQGGTLRRIMGSDPKGFNWVTESSVDVSELQGYVHNTFARADFNNPDAYVPELAYKITANEDYTEYVIHLRKGIYWHVPNVDFSKGHFDWLREPRELKAEDAVFFFELMKNSQVEAGSIKSYYDDLKGAEVIDDYTFRVTWKRSVAQSKIFTIGLYPMPKWLFSRDEHGEELPAETLGLAFNNHWSAATPIGTGPYKFERYEAGVRLVLQRNDKYFGERPPIDRLEYQIVRDPETQFIRLRANEVDFMGNIPAPRYKSDIVDGTAASPFKNGQLKHEVIDVFAYYYLGWNADKPMFADKRVRWAMTHALNRQGIIDNVYHGLGEIQTGPYYYQHPAIDPSIEAIPFDLAKAAKLLDEAGWIDTNGDGIRDKMIDGQRVDFKFTLTAYNRPEVRSQLSIYREDLRKIGIMMQPDPVEWPLMQRRMDEKEFDAFTGGWGLSWFNDPYQLWHSSQADVPKGSNRVGFRNTEADKIIEDLRTTFDAEERITKLRALHRIIHADQPYTFFYAPKAVVAWQPKMQNMVFQKTRPQTYSLPWYIDESAAR
ncbi:MAG: hypothetical protein H0U74_16760 [Bradymonadaceae bacterium]|nr:hypothetical protein [Lujinxingiaceae bacterium]